MTWSLLNSMLAEKVNELLDEAGKHYGPEIARFYPRGQAAAIIHAALWGHSSRDSGTAGAYAAMNLFSALELKGWTFDQEEADALQRFRAERTADRRAALAASEAQP